MEVKFVNYNLRMYLLQKLLFKLEEIVENYLIIIYKINFGGGQNCLVG